MQIKTQRLVLRKPQVQDIHRLVTLIGDRRVSENLSRVPYPYTEEDGRRWLDIVAQEPLNLNMFFEDELIGGIGLTPSDGYACELGYWLGVEYWSMGFATEAVTGLLSAAGAILGNERLIARVYEGNQASINVLKKTGFHFHDKGRVFSLSRQAYVTTDTFERELSVNK